MNYPADPRQLHVAVLDAKTVQVTVLLANGACTTDNIRPEDLATRLGNIAVRLKDTARRI